MALYNFGGEDDFSGSMLSEYLKKKIPGARSKLTSAIQSASLPAQSATVPTMPEEKKIFGILPEKYALPAAIGAGVLLMLALKKRGKK
jgi:hypothetical protein